MRIIEFSVKNPVFSNLLMATIIIFGLYVGSNLPKELFPSIGFEKVTIVTIYENSVAEDIEKLITIPIEDKISGIAHYTEHLAALSSDTKVLQEPRQRDLNAFTSKVSTVYTNTEMISLQT